MQVDVSYNDLEYKNIVEEEANPLSEFLIELANIIGLYFGVSVISIAYAIKKLQQRFYKYVLFNPRSQMDTFCSQTGDTAFDTVIRYK